MAMLGFTMFHGCGLSVDHHPDVCVQGSPGIAVNESRIYPQAARMDLMQHLAPLHVEHADDRGPELHLGEFELVDVLMQTVGQRTSPRAPDVIPVRRFGRVVSGVEAPSQEGCRGRVGLCPAVTSGCA